MKKYEKPSLAVLTLSANDSLCACDQKTKGSDVWNVFDVTGDGVFDDKDVEAAGYFGTGEECDSEIIGVCKFTAANMLFVS